VTAATATVTPTARTSCATIQVRWRPAGPGKPRQYTVDLDRPQGDTSPKATATTFQINPICIRSSRDSITSRVDQNGGSARGYQEFFAR
jgi:hypothetical protein